MIECTYCGKSYSEHGIGTHIWRKHGEGVNHNPNIGYENGRIVWNKGLKTPEVTKVKLRAALKNNPPSGFASTKEAEVVRRERISKKLIGNNHGGHCKWFNVDGVSVQGTWERDFALWLNELDIMWERGKPFTYSKDGLNHTYTPDFFLPNESVFIEIKGHWWGDDENKTRIACEQNTELNDSLVVIDKDTFKVLTTDFRLVRELIVSTMHA